LIRELDKESCFFNDLNHNHNHDIMPKSLEKTRKKIAKKKGNITALHENSRDSQRLRRAQMRDDKLVKVASLRRKNDQPLSEWPDATGC
jgi:Translation machinery-associated protein 16